MGERFNEAIAERGVKKLANFSRQTGVSPQTLNQLKQGLTKFVSSDTLFAIADGLKFKARWLATGKGPRRAEDKISTKGLTDIISGVEKALVMTNVTHISPHHKAEMIVAFYEDFATNKLPFDEASVARILKLNKHLGGLFGNKDDDEELPSG